MISKAIKGYFKSRLVSLSSELPAVMADMTRVNFRHIDQSREFKDPMAYEQALFLSKHRKRYQKLVADAQGAERNELTKALDRLDHFAELKDFLDYCYDVHRTVLLVWVKMASDISNGKIVMSQEITDEEEQKMIRYAVQRYEDLLEKVDAFPVWKEKIVGEIGYMVNFLHSIHVYDVNLEELLKNFNKQEFFK